MDQHIFAHPVTDCCIEVQSFSYVLTCRTLKISFDNVEYICKSCLNTLKKGLLPTIAVAIGLQLDEIPQQLQDLNTLETVFISRRIPFMKLLALPRGRQRSILSVLPRMPSSDSFVTVKLKRKLQYREHVFVQNIRPKKIEDALHNLKYNLQNPLYSDVILNDNWRNDSDEDNQNLWNSLTGSTPDIDEDLTLEDDDNESNEGAEDDERSRSSGIPFDTCIQPKDITADNNLLLNYAPGENKKPRSFHSDEKAEELSFPHLFPTGKF